MRWPPPPDWPMATHSTQVLSRPHRWHVQIAGTGDDLLLIHGAGGATQSWRHLFPRLAQSHRVIAVDLPGQGFSQSGAQRRFGLDPMAEDLLALTRQEGWQPKRVIGHSAGTAIALRMTELGLETNQIVGINAALGNFKGVAGWLFPFLAKALAVTPLSASLFASTATPRKINQLIAGTGSTLDPDGQALYLRLCQDQTHVAATLAMMAQWSLDGLLARLPQIATPTHFLIGDNDKAVPPDTSARAAARMPDARCTMLPGLGHLAHEEDAAQIASHLT